MRATLLAFTLLASVFQLAAQQPSTIHSMVSRSLEGMKSPDFNERSKAFEKANGLLVSDIPTPRDIDRLKLGMIQLLFAENAKINLTDDELLRQAATANDGCGNGTDSCAGDEDEYYPSLIATVADFNDERAIPALVGAMPYSSDARKALLEFGDKGFAAALDQFKTSRNALLRASALGMVIHFLAGRNDSASRTQIKELIRSALADPRPVVRSQAIRQIDCLDDRQDYVPLLEKIAKTDPWKLPGKGDDGGDGDEFYPVRSDARQALRHIKNNQPCGSAP